VAGRLESAHAFPLHTVGMISCRYISRYVRSQVTMQCVEGFKVGKAAG
jgi:hypothetical protein